MEIIDKMKLCKECDYYVRYKGNNLCGRYADFNPHDPTDYVEFADCKDRNADGKCVLYRRRGIFRTLFQSVRRLNKVRRDMVNRYGVWTEDLKED